MRELTLWEVLVVLIVVMLGGVMRRWVGVAGLGVVGWVSASE